MRHTLINKKFSQKFLLGKICRSVFQFFSVEKNVLVLFTKFEHNYQFHFSNRWQDWSSSGITLNLGMKRNLWTFSSKMLSSRLFGTAFNSSISHQWYCEFVTHSSPAILLVASNENYDLLSTAIQSEAVIF